MLFKSKKKLNIYEKVYTFIWPKSGWNRLIKYVSLRIKRLPGSPHKISIGFSFGVAAAMTPFFGIHFLIGIFLSWLFKGSIAASIIGNFIGNPWTFPFIILINYKLGIYVYNTDEKASFNLELVYNEFVSIISSIFKIMIDGNIENFLNSYQQLQFLPAVLYGSIFTCIFTGLVSYFLIKNVIVNYQNRKLKKSL